MSHSTNVKLGQVVSFQTGKLNSNAETPHGAYPFFTCSQETLRTDTFSFDTEAVLLAGNNANGIYPLKFFRGRFDAYQRTYIVRSRDEERLINRFLFYALQPKLSLLKSISTGAATKFLTLTILNDVELRLPPVATQRKIASVLGAYDELIENNRRRIEILEEMARRLYREWFVQFRFPGHAHVPLTDSPLGKIPKGWEVKPFDDLMRTCSGFAFKSATFQPSARYKVVTIKNVQDGSFLAESDSQIDSPPSNMPDHCHLESGDILLSLTGNVGRACFVFGRDFLLNQRVAKLVPHQRSNRGFVYFTFRCEETQTRLEMISNGVAQQNLSPVQMGKMPFVIPADDVLKKFAALVEPICDHIVSLNIRNRNLQTTRDLLLPRLISGELDVSELPIEVEEAARDGE